MEYTMHLREHPFYMIKSGKKISVVLNAEDGSFSKSFTVEHCEKWSDINH